MKAMNAKTATEVRQDDAEKAMNAKAATEVVPKINVAELWESVVDNAKTQLKSGAFLGR